MKTLTRARQAFLTRAMPRWAFWLVLAGLVLLRMGIALCQRAFLTPEGAPIDDMLMVRAAQSLVDGGWMGEYGPFAIAKNMGFALWLAAMHVLNIPLLAANCALWLLACGFAMWALRGVFRGGVSRLALFALLAFQPFSFAGFVMRAYRDAIFPAFCLLLFAGVVGMALRAGQPKLCGFVGCAAAAGVGLAAAWLLHEDGAVLLIFALCALALLAVFVGFTRLGRRKLAKGLLCALPFGVLAAAVLAFSAANNTHYGVFVVNDFTSGAFPRAYGAMVAVSRAESGHTLRVPVTRAALDGLLAEVPALAELEPYLAEGPVPNGYASKETGEYGGSFYYAIRLAAYYAGKTPAATAAQDYWRLLETQIGAAVAEGRLQSEKPANSVIPAFNGSLLGPAAAETGRGFMAVMTFADCDPRPVESVGKPKDIAAVAQFLHVPVQEGYVEGTDVPYYNIAQKAAFLLCDVLVWLYRVLVWPLLALGLFEMLRALACGLKCLFKQRRATRTLLNGVMLLGLFLSFVLRLVVAGYMEVAAFGIGTYVMYLCGGVPALLLFGAWGVAGPENSGMGPKGKEDDLPGEAH